MSRNPHKSNKTFPWRRKRRPTGGAVGTEAKAIENMTKNSNAFGYPKEGFVTRIEHSLLYNMIGEPDVYPAAAVLEQIDEEDFSIYLEVADESSRLGGEPSVSYAQLSAIVALSAEKYPPKERGEDEQSDDDQKQQTVSQKVCNDSPSVCHSLCRRTQSRSRS